MKDRSGHFIGLALDEKCSATGVLPLELGAIQPGSFIGTAAMTAAGRTLRALAGRNGFTPPM